MAESNVDYSVVLADLKARRDKLDQAIAVIEALAGTGGLGPLSGTTEVANIRSDTFFGMSVPQAVKKYLGMTGRVPKSPQDITEALKQGGQEQASYNNVYTALKRLPDVIKLPSGDWGLSDWYPGAKKSKQRTNGDEGEAESEAAENNAGDSEGEAA
jgi:hypothetical protein